jgi:signal transduction histidine kinase
MYIKLATKYFIRSIILGLFLICFSTTEAQLQYNFERINTDNGLPTNAIKGLQFDEKNRFLWVATESGIVRYNGHDIQSFGENEQSKILDGRIVFFDKTQNGILYGKLIDESVFLIDKNKAVLQHKKIKLSGQDDYLSYKYGVRKKYSKNMLPDIELLDYIVNGDIYTINKNYLYKYSNNGFDSLLYIENDIKGFVINNNIYLYNKDYKFFKYNINKNYLLPIENTISNLIVKGNSKNVLTQANIIQNYSNDAIYVIIGSKLFKLIEKNNQFDFVLITNQLPENEFVKYIQIDDLTNTIYLGTDNRGMLVGRPKYFNRVLPNDAKNAISSSAYAQLLLSNGNIQINTGRVFGKSSINAPNVFYRPSETATYLSKDSVLYFTNSDGLIEYDLKINKIKLITTADNNIKISRNNFIELGDYIYSFNESGIMKKNTQKIDNWKYILKFKKVPFNFIFYSVKQINKNEILAATTDGLYKYNFQSNSFNLFYRDKTNANFRTIYKLNNYFLIGSYGAGVFMFQNDTIKKVPLDQNKYLNYTHCFIQDNQNRVWASTNKGLFMSPAQSLIDFWSKGPGNIKFRYFGKSDGIDQLEFNGGCSPCAIKLNNNYFSFPGIDGLIQFIPDSIPIFNLQPKVYLDRFIVDGKMIDLNNISNEFNPRTKNIELHIGISGMLSQENIMLEYKLDEEAWVRINVNDAKIKYNNPGFGKHTISIRVRNTINSKWHNLEFPFTIAYPIALHPYMYFVYLLIIVGLVLLYIRFKTIIYQRRQRDLEREVASKTASLNTLNDYLLKRNQAKDHVIAIMNHDILTPLKYMHITAKNIANSNNEKQIKSSIKQIANTSKELEYLTSNMLNWVKFDNIETLPKKQKFDLNVLVTDLLDFVSPFIDNKDIQLINQIPSECYIDNWPDSLRVLLYNLIINAIKATNKGFIEIGFKQFNEGYIIFVKDTGMGMNAALIHHLTSGNAMDNSFDHNKRFKSGNGVGYQIIRNVIKLMNAHIDIESLENNGTTINVIFI